MTKRRWLPCSNNSLKKTHTHILTSPATCPTGTNIPCPPFIQAAMSPSVRSFVVLQKDLPTSDDEIPLVRQLVDRSPRYLILTSQWSKVVDFLSSPFGQRGLRLYTTAVRTKEGHRGVTPQSAVAAQWASSFASQLQSRSPLLVNDKTMTEKALVAEHPRNPWDGNFDPRRQAIKVNHFVCSSNLSATRH